MPTRKFNIPTVFVIFGATGDLARKKIFPALFNLYITKQLPEKFKVIGAARKAASEAEFDSYLRKILIEFEGSEPDKKQLEGFLEVCSYHQAQFGNMDDYKAIAKELGMNDNGWSICSNKLFYLAVPPEQYEMLLQHIADSGLTEPCSPEEGWTRVLIEKPFGKDAKTAENIESLLGKLFKEEQIYRIDHYLAKEMIQNILTFRFANNLLEESWNNKFIEKIEVRMLESFGVENRGAFFDGLGALRDVGQNHMLQMLALATMNCPASFSSDHVRESRQQLLQDLRIPDEDYVKRYTFRAQYEGYKEISGVKQNSQTETYFRIKAFIDNPRWQGVPIILESGKRLDKTKSEIVITYKDTVPGIAGSDTTQKIKNKVFFRIDPKEEINIAFVSKKPGLKMDIEERDFEFVYRKTKASYEKAEDYQRILLDCIRGDQFLFVTTSEVEAMWRFIDPIVSSWAQKIVPLRTYPQNTKTIRDESKIIEDIPVTATMPKHIGVIGLGKMGKGIAQQLAEKGWEVHGYNRTFSVAQELEKDGIKAHETIKDLIEALPTPRVLWIMVPAGNAVEGVLFGQEGIAQYLEKGDIVIDAGNSLYKDAKPRAEKLKQMGINFMDVGTSGGPNGARYGACLMIGGDKETYEYLLPLFTALALPRGFQYFGNHGAGHFVKMVHNGIEYGMMQAIAEGFAVMKQSDFDLNLTDVANLYNNGSVVESRLIGWLEKGLQVFGEDMKDISMKINHSGEGQWTVDAAKELKVEVPIIEGSLDFRKTSEEKPAITNKFVNVQRTMFGGHEVKK